VRENKNTTKPTFGYIAPAAQEDTYKRLDAAVSKAHTKEAISRSGSPLIGGSDVITFENLRQFQNGRKFWGETLLPLLVGKDWGSAGDRSLLSSASRA
jgi:hypothetical protein